MKGMTGFGRAKVTNGTYEVNVEISSVNKRHLDIIFRLPREYQHLDSSLRRELSARLFRGQVSVAVAVLPLEMLAVIPQINWPKVEEEMKALRQISEHFGCSVPLEKAAFEIWRNQVVSAEGKQEEGVPEVEALVLKGVQEAFVQYDTRRSAEGVFLADDLRKRTSLLREMKNQIAQKMEGHVEQIQHHLTQMVEKIVPGLPADDRILREVVLYADKADISEELSRIDHHLDHVDKVLVESAAAGKLLEFIFQELLREFNTLGAKTTVSDVSTIVVLAKTELEKMREQVQNVE